MLQITPKRRFTLILLIGLLVPSLGMSVWLSYEIERALAKNTATLTNALELKALVRDLLPLMLVQDDATKAMLLDPELEATLTQKKADAYARQKTALEHLGMLTDDAFVQGKITDLSQLDRDHLRPTDHAILELLKSDPAQARHQYFEQFAPLRQNYEKLIVDLTEHVRARADQLTKEIELADSQLARETRYTLAMGILTIVAVILLLSRLVARSRENIDALLASLDDGLFYFNATGYIARERSASLNKILPESERVRSLHEFFALLGFRDNERLNSCLQLLWPRGDDSFYSDFATTITMLPRRFEIAKGSQAMVLQLDYRPQYDRRRKLKRVICVLSDISNRIQLEQKMVADGERIRRFSKAVSNIENFLDFRSEAITIMRRINDALYHSTSRDSTELKRDMHTLKGVLAMFEFNQLASAIHELEGVLASPPTDAERQLQASWNFVKDKWKFEMTDLEKFLGIEHLKHQMIVSAQRYEESLAAAQAAKNDKLASELVSMRCFSLRLVFQQYENYAHDLCKKLGNKSVEFNYKDDSHLLGYDEIRNLDGCLVHLIGNCIDHGIEKLAVRVKAGKPPAGRVNVGAFRTKHGFLHLTLKDDGGGVDGDRLAQKAVKMGLWTSAQAAKATYQEKIELMFAPNLSSRDEVSQTSGRGVGMDAVKAMVEEMAGSISVYSDPGVGTQFRISVPLFEPWSLLRPTSDG